MKTHSFVRATTRTPVGHLVIGDSFREDEYTGQDIVVKDVTQCRSHKTRVHVNGTLCYDKAFRVSRFVKEG